MTKNVDAHIFSFPSNGDTFLALIKMTRLYFHQDFTPLALLFDVKTNINFLSTCHTGGQWRAVTSEINHATGTPKTGYAIGHFMGS